MVESILYLVTNYSFSSADQDRLTRAGDQHSQLEIAIVSYIVRHDCVKYGTSVSGAKNMQSQAALQLGDRVW